MELRNASVKLPADLHQQIKDELEAKNITMSQFFEMAATEHLSFVLIIKTIFVRI